MGNIMRVSDYKKLDAQQKQSYLNTLTRDELASFMEGLGYTDGFERGKQFATKRISIVDRIVRMNDRKSKVTGLYIFGIIITVFLTTGFILPSKYLISMLLMLLIVQGYFIFNTLFKKK